MRIYVSSKDRCYICPFCFPSSVHTQLQDTVISQEAANAQECSGSYLSDNPFENHTVSYKLKETQESHLNQDLGKTSATLKHGEAQVLQKHLSTPPPLNSARTKPHIPQLEANAVGWERKTKVSLQGSCPRLSPRRGSTCSTCAGGTKRTRVPWPAGQRQPKATNGSTASLAKGKPGCRT